MYSIKSASSRFPNPALIWLLMLISSSAVRAGNINEDRLALARRLWEAELQNTGNAFRPSEYYPTEESLAFLSAYCITRDDRYAAQAARQLDYAHSREKDGLFLTSKNLTTRDY